MKNQTTLAAQAMLDLMISHDSIAFEQAELLDIETSCAKEVYGGEENHLEITFALLVGTMTDRELDIFWDRYLSEKYPNSPAYERQFRNRDTDTKVSVILRKEGWFMQVWTIRDNIRYEVLLNKFEKASFKTRMDKWLKAHSEYGYSFDDITRYSKKYYARYCKNPYIASYIDPLGELTKVDNLRTKGNIYA